MRILGIKPKGREKMTYVKNPYEFVRIYDGNENPLGKAYSKQELINMPRIFRSVKLSLYFFPSLFLPFRIPEFVRKFLDRNCGFMIPAICEK